MAINQLKRLMDYVRLLRQNPAESIVLSDDLMIHVTGFFRDPLAWESLKEKVVLPLMRERESNAPIRCWVAACASGEEAYSLAILLLETAESLGKRFDIRVFATDTAERTLRNARNGVYPAGIETEVSAARLERFFDRDDAGYRVKREVREVVVFAPQNVLQDPPFSKLDICSCRNLLIYLEPELQRKLLILLHFGLREGGVLFLGSSETISPTDDMYEVIDKKTRLFRRVGPTRHGLIDFAPLHTRRTDAEERATPRATIAQLTAKRLLDHHTPSAVVIDRQQRVVYVHGDVERFLTIPRGDVTRELTGMARDEVRGALRLALQRAASSGAPVAVRGGVYTVDGAPRRLLISVSEFEGREHQLVCFELRPEPAARLPKAGGKNSERLSEELQRVRDELQSTIEQLQASNEELKASNEELTSVNEELQSTNEELETSKEELQSLNEELATLNAQLEAKVREHEAISNDLSSLLTSTAIAVIFLDTRFRIRRFTQAVQDFFDLIPSDLGRPLSDLARKFDDPRLLPDCRTVLETLQPIEREVRSDSGRVYLRRLLPYRAADNRIDGLVVTFLDITPLKAAQEALRLSEERSRRLVNGAADFAVMLLDTEGRIAEWNVAAERLFALPESEALGQYFGLLFTAQDRAAGVPEQEIEQARSTGRTHDERWHVRRDGRLFWASGTLNAVHDAAGQINGFVKVIRDDTSRKQAEQERDLLLEREQKARLEAESAARTTDHFLAVLSHELRTPLSSILLWTRLLLRANFEPKQLREGLEAVARSAEAQNVLLEELLDSSRIRSGKLRLSKRTFELNPWMQEILEYIRPVAAAIHPSGGRVPAQPG